MYINQTRDVDRLLLAITFRPNFPKLKQCSNETQEPDQHNSSTVHCMNILREEGTTSLLQHHIFSITYSEYNKTEKTNGRNNKP